MKLIDEAEANPLPDQAQLRAIRENQKRRQHQLEEKAQQEAARQIEEAAPDATSKLVERIPAYPGRPLATDGSVLTSMVH